MFHAQAQILVWGAVAGACKLNDGVAEPEVDSSKGSFAWTERAAPALARAAARAACTSVLGCPYAMTAQIHASSTDERSGEGCEERIGSRVRLRDCLRSSILLLISLHYLLLTSCLAFRPAAHTHSFIISQLLSCARSHLNRSRWSRESRKSLQHKPCGSATRPSASTLSTHRISSKPSSSPSGAFGVCASPGDGPPLDSQAASPAERPSTCTSPRP